MAVDLVLLFHGYGTLVIDGFVGVRRARRGLWPPSSSPHHRSTPGVYLRYHEKGHDDIDLSTALPLIGDWSNGVLVSTAAQLRCASSAGGVCPRGVQDNMATQASELAPRVALCEVHVDAWQ
jgi:hypothetical protein